MNKIVILTIVTILLIGIVAFTIFYYSNTSSSRSNDELLEQALQQRELQKLNLSVYIKSGISEESIATLIASIKKQFPDITLDYRTAEQSLASWIEKNSSDKAALKALEELGENPLGAELKIVTNSAEETKIVADYIESLDKNEIIDGLIYIAD